MTISAYVLGNGTSRHSVNLEKLRSYGKIYGCNALYRDFAPDVLIATDPGISKEIQDSGYARTNTFYTRHPEPNSGAKLIEYNFGYSSGPIALSYASIGAEVVYLLGFDFAGLAGLFNNVYANTMHYKQSDQPETYYGNWVNQVQNIVKNNANRRYIRVVNNNIVPQQLEYLPNFEHQQLELFLQNHK